MGKTNSTKHWAKQTLQNIGQNKLYKTLGKTNSTKHWAKQTQQKTDDILYMKSAFGNRCLYILTAIYLCFTSHLQNVVVLPFNDTKVTKLRPEVMTSLA
jgi:hypothetical protein